MFSKNKEKLKELLFSQTSQLPTSSVKRFGKTAFTLMKTGNLLRKNNNPEYIPSVEELANIVSSIGNLKGIAMKMGQIMSYIDVAMPQELQQALSLLQTHAPPMPLDEVKEIIATDLKENARPILDHLSSKPIAAASIGQVHTGHLPDGKKVAVKIQYPGVEQAIKSDFKPAAVGTTMAALFYPGAKIDGFIEEAKQRFIEECDYVHERHAQEAFYKLYNNHPIISIPRVYGDYSSKHVITTEFIEGISFDDFLEANPDQQTKNKIGEALFEFYLGSLFRFKLYNCDPHPGNYLFLSNGGLAILDYGCTREFDNQLADSMVNLTKAVHSDIDKELHQAFLALKMVTPGKKYDFSVARDLVRAFYGPMLEDKSQQVSLGNAKNMQEIFKAKRQLMKLNLPGEFLFLFRIRFGLMSILARLGAEANWYQLERTYLESQ